jgi:hypothetical protein
VLYVELCNRNRKYEEEENMNHIACRSSDIIMDVATTPATREKGRERKEDRKQMFHVYVFWERNQHNHRTF